MTAAYTGNTASAAPQIKARAVPDAPKKFRPLDVFVIIICLLIAAWGAREFYLSLFQTLSSDLDPIGYVTIKVNTIQRRQGERVLWDRLKNESPVYPGDLIRVAEQSSATLHFAGNNIRLDENTMIRVILTPDGKPQIEIAGGSISVDTGTSGGNISLVIGGRIIEPEVGTVLSVTAVNDEEVSLNIIEGTAIIIDEVGEIFEAEAGEEIDLTATIEEIAAAHEPEPEIIEEEPVIEEIVEEMQVEEAPVVVTLLPSPTGRIPANNYRIGPDEFRRMRNIVFNWNAVNEANAYIFTLYQQTPQGRRQIIQAGPQITTSYTLSDLTVLDRGTFIWQVEAVFRRDDIIQRHGQPGENALIFDIPQLGQVRTGEIGVMFGN